MNNTARINQKNLEALNKLTLKPFDIPNRLQRIGEESMQRYSDPELEFYYWEVIANQLREARQENHHDYYEAVGKWIPF